MTGTLPDGYPLEPFGVDDYPVKLGSMLLTVVDPQKGYERAYNRWYERDHYISGCLVGPYNFAGSRWVATREMKDLRWGTTDVADPLDAGSYVAIYWIERDHHKDWDDWALKQVHWLYSHGRGFDKRDHVHTATFDYLDAAYRDSDPVPVELALDHRYDGIVALWFDGRNGVEAADLHRQVVDSGAAKELLDGSPIEIAASWVPRPEFRNSRDSAPMSLGSPGGDVNRLVQLLFVGGDVRDALPAVRRYTDRLAADGVADLLLAAPFLRTVVGTDTYTDQLW